MNQEPKDDEIAWGEGGLQTDLLDSDRLHVKNDLRLVSRAIRENWAIPALKRTELVDRLLEIVEKREVAVMTKEGVEVIDGPADTNAIGAARVLVAMDAINQTDYWNQNKNDRLDAGQSTENVAFRPAPTYDVPLPPDIAKRLTGAN